MIPFKQITILLFNTITTLIIINKYYYIKYEKKVAQLNAEIVKLKRELKEFTDKIHNDENKNTCEYEKITYDIDLLKKENEKFRIETEKLKKITEEKESEINEFINENYHIM